RSWAAVFGGGFVPLVIMRWSVWQTSQLPRASASVVGGLPEYAIHMPSKATSHAALPAVVAVMRWPTAPMWQSTHSTPWSACWLLARPGPPAYISRFGCLVVPLWLWHDSQSSFGGCRSFDC